MYRVLVVDDDPAARDLLGAALNLPQWQLCFSDCAERAIELCAEKLPDLAVIDVQLPGMSGIELCRWLKDRAKRTFVPVILITSQTHLCDKTDGLNYGADEYTSKPFSLPELQAQVRALLRIKELTNQLQETRDLLEQRERELVAMEVAGAAAHEMGQPLTSLILNCEILQRNPLENADSAAVIQKIQQECSRLRAILSALQQLEGYRTKSYLGETRILDLKIAPESA